MARIRTIKPEFPQSETIGRLSRDGRLLFVQLWTIVDDAGRTRAASRMLASLLYPYDDDAGRLMSAWLDELEANGLIRRYVVDGSQYLEVANWLKHQKIDKPSASRLPAFVDGSSKPREDSRSLDTDLGPRTSTKDLDQDIRAVAKATRPRATRFDEFWSAYPRRKGANPRAEAEEIYNRHVRDGIPEQEMIDGAKAFARQEAANNGTPYIEQAVKFLRRKHWVGSQDPPAPIAINDGKVFVKCESEQWFAWQAYLKRTTGKGSPRNPHADGWRFDSEWPPGHQSAAA